MATKSLSSRRRVSSNWISAPSPQRCAADLMRATPWSLIPMLRQRPSLSQEGKVMHHPFPLVHVLSASACLHRANALTAMSLILLELLYQPAALDQHVLLSIHHCCVCRGLTAMQPATRKYRHAPLLIFPTWMCCVSCQLQHKSVCITLNALHKGRLCLGYEVAKSIYTSLPAACHAYSCL
jgi:hypothetical protein